MKNRTFSFLAICGTAVVWLCFTSSAVAQFRTSIQGVVTDPTGAVIPGATLTLKNLSHQRDNYADQRRRRCLHFNAPTRRPF